MSKDIEETAYIPVSQLKESYGFTDAIIKKFLGECDETKSNPKSKSKAPIKLYRIDRVNRVLADDAFIEWKNKKEATTSKRKQVIAEPILMANDAPKTKSNVSIFDFDSGLSVLETADWVDFSWEHFKIEDDAEFTEEQKIHAVTAVKKILSISYWFTPQVFFDAFVQDTNSSTQLASEYKSSIIANGWTEIPLVSLMIRDRQDRTRMMLDSGHHQWTALKELFEAGSLPNNFKIPVFDLKRLRLRDQYSANLDFALRYAVTGGTLGHDFAIEVIAKGWFTRLCTGVAP